MTLSRWRGVNVLVTDGAGLPVLVIGRLGNVVEGLSPEAREGPIETGRSAESLARSVASWIEFTLSEPGELPADDIHPNIRERVLELAPEWVDASAQTR